MSKSIDRISSAILNKEKIGIFGDYDVDGASSTALLGNFFKEIKQNFEIYIPDRKLEGYGPTINGFKKLLEHDIKIIITVDCGTMSFEAINFANHNKVDVIVIDHHQSETKLPDAFSIINPNQINDESNLNYLCAAGVCFMFLVSLNANLKASGWYKKNHLKEPNLLNYLDLVSLGTICDVVPLIGLNRAIVKQGLKVVNYKKNLGLKTLIDVCNIETKTSTYHLGYVLGPRINAGGRVGKCYHGANLLLNTNPKDTYKLAVN
jgi:Single-stranded DNA-specific exonuclease